MQEWAPSAQERGRQTVASALPLGQPHPVPAVGAPQAVRGYLVQVEPGAQALCEDR